jgi:alpha-L-arabinofuranosidase
MNRREFLLSTAALALAPRSSLAAGARIEILPEEPIGTISPTIYGHFTEHLGGCIYDGLWVGDGSKIPNAGGIRKSVIDHLKRINAPVVRWPGGCFADSYNWRDGVGPRASRPTRVNFWAETDVLKKAAGGPQKYEPNAFGTNEFARFCKLAGAEPYFAGNLRSTNAFDFYEWIDYCNAPRGATSMANLRLQGGDPEPLNVKYWGVGNESWGCGGDFTGDEYAIEFRRFTTWVPTFGVDLKYIASGPNGADYAWTHSFFQKMTEHNRRALNNVFGTALHYYCGTTGNGVANEFDPSQWYELLNKANRMEELVTRHWQIMGGYDADRRVKLVVDEWGAWHHTDPTIAPNYLWAYYPTLRDALVSSITLDTFNRHADKVVMANAAQLINNIHTSMLAAEDKFTVTPVYHVFDMYAAHQGNTSVRAVLSAPNLADSAAKGLFGLAGSCSMRDKRVVLTVTNPDLQNAQETQIVIAGGARVTDGRATVLTASDPHARNTFAQPDAVKPAAPAPVPAQSPFVYSFAPASVTKLELDLA